MRASCQTNAKHTGWISASVILTSLSATSD